ncbi:MAG TPA: hypothetical protein VFF73_03340 [Planctomycetota bacterium]|nr:hypothetical protein [Planctomycetota bacterium]
MSAEQAPSPREAGGGQGWGASGASNEPPHPASPPLRGGEGIGRVLAAALILLAIFLLGVERGLDLPILTRNPALRNAKIADFDELWHLASGRVIAETGHVPDRDPFTFTAGETPWVNTNWLAQVVLWAAYRTGGIQLDWCLGIALWLGAVALVHLRAARRASCLGAISVTLYALVVLRRTSEVRPQGWTFLLLALALYLVDVLGESRRRALALGLVLVLADQMHGGFVFLDVALLLAALGSIIETRSLRSRRTQLLGVALAVGVAGFVLHPHHLQALVHPLRYELDAHVRVMAQATPELAPPDLRGPHGALVEGPIFLLLLAACASRRITLADAILVVPFAHLALTTGRGVHYFAIVAAAPLAAALDVRPVEGRLVNRLVPAALGLALLVTVVGRARSFAPGTPGDTSDPLLSTHADDADMAHAIAALPRARVFNPPEPGGCLLWILYPERQVFIDSRGDFHALSGAFEETRTVMRTDEGWDQILDRRGCDLALVQHGFPLDTALRARGWKDLHKDATWALLARPSRKND